MELEGLDTFRDQVQWIAKELPCLPCFVCLCPGDWRRWGWSARFGPAGFLNLASGRAGMLSRYGMASCKALQGGQSTLPSQALHFCFVNAKETFPCIRYYS